ncbi:hypothetical protein NO1_0335 [Candidatus Termititenax aidoneus]|uniref:N-terminal domain-containing protein n=1 Tax=Termititenax aidoneus TaxID=2218524 RepID=A0A388TAY0_TERA1|nr:hypothetical protein NO1_0335 [Candidatus Termititenax aidoneus]
MRVENIINDYVLGYVENNGLDFLNQGFLYRNMASEQNYSVLNQALLSIYCRQHNIKNNVFFGSYMQIKEMGGKIMTGSTGALLTYFRNCNSGGRLAYYHSFPLCNTSIYADFAGLQDDYIYPDKLYETDNLLQKGSEKTDKELPRDNRLDTEEYFRKAIVFLAKNLEPQTNDNLTNTLTASYLLAQCGLSRGAEKENLAELKNKMKSDTNYFIRSAGTAQKKIKGLLN